MSSKFRAVRDGDPERGREERARVRADEEEVLAQGHEDQEDQDEFFDQANPKVFPHRMKKVFYVFPFALYHHYVIIVLVSVMT